MLVTASPIAFSPAFGGGEDCGVVLGGFVSELGFSWWSCAAVGASS